MLRQLRSEKFMRTVMLGVMAIVIPSFVVFYGWNNRGGGSNSLPEGGSAATVKLDTLGKYEVRQSEFSQAKEVLSQKLGAYAQANNIQLDRSLMERLADDRSVTSEAISLAILKDFAKDKGIVVTEDEVNRTLEQQVPPQYRQQFYDMYVTRRGMTMDQFIQNMQSSMLYGRVRATLAAQTRVTFYDAWLEYLLRKEKLVADQVKFQVADYKPKIKVDEGELKKYFEQNLAKFHVPDQLEYAYILVNKDDLKSSVTVNNDDITSYYEGHKEEYRLPRAAHVRQIFLDKMSKSAEAGTSQSEATRAKANELYQRAAKGEDFASLASQFSEEKYFPPREDDQTTAADQATTAGGNLGFVLEPTAKAFYGDTWTTTVFNMASGSVQGPIETPRGFYIVKLEALREGTVQPLDKVRDIVKERVAEEKIGPLFEQTGQQLRDNSQKYTSLDKLAQATSQTLRVTPKVDRGTQVLPGIGTLGEFAEAVADLQKGGRSDVLSDENKHLVIEVQEEFPAHDPKLEEVRDQVVKAFTDQKAQEMARSDAEGLKSKSANFAAMQTAAKDMGVSVTQTRPFTRSEVAAALGLIPNFEQDSSQLTTGSITLSQVGPKDEPTGYVVWHLANKEAPSKAEFEKDVPGIVRELSEKKADILLSEYLRDRWSQLGSRIQLKKSYGE